MEQEQEIWKPIKGYEGLYEVSNLGNVRSKTRIIKQPNNKKGYPCANVRDINGKQKTIETHRLVAIAFIPNPDNKSQVDHIDANKLNNKVSNLRWTTPKENSNNSNSLEHLRAKMKDDKFLKKRWERRKEVGGKTAPKTIYMYSKFGEFIREYSSLAEAAKEFKGNHATISVAVDSPTRTAYGYKWYSKKIEP